ncbi:MAG: hypothetical protein ACXAEU_05100 [Candidatus Hodarchaeales archaeon]|jgi:hypothetical protein
MLTSLHSFNKYKGWLDMPFINIDSDLAEELLDDRSILLDLLKKELINPKEHDLLMAVIDLKEGDDTARERIKKMCSEHFSDEVEKSVQRLEKFATSEQKRVSWVLFSRTNQFIRYEQANPFEDYYPREASVLLVDTFETLVPDARLDADEEE